MKILRFLLEVLLSVILAPAIIMIELVWFGCCIYAAKLTGSTMKNGVKCWWRYLLMGLEMNKDFVINGL